MEVTTHKKKHNETNWNEMGQTQEGLSKVE
jgi:hypothetical protein